ncbi:MAG: hypothetical protein BroJett011_14330 [Chloroflexota bacterium]|nr:MAG: hypothetical protein BroJett011_14330 [Chloroflexota bacterium]
MLLLHEIERYEALGLPYSSSPAMHQLLGVYLVYRQQETERYQKAALYSYAIQSLAEKIKACRQLARKVPLEEKLLLLQKAQTYQRAAEQLRAKFTEVIAHAAD